MNDTAKQKYYENRFGNVFGPMVVTPVGRATFCNLAQPNQKFQPAKYSVTILFDKTDDKLKDQLNLMIGACKELIAFKYKGGKIPIFSTPPIQDGSEKSYQGFEGCYFITAKSNKIPEVIDQKRKPLDPAQILPGMKIRCVVAPILFDKGVAWSLSCVQFVEDDSIRFYGGPDPKSLLDDVKAESMSLEQSADDLLGGKKSIDLL